MPTVKVPETPIFDIFYVPSNAVDGDVEPRLTCKVLPVVNLTAVFALNAFVAAPPAEFEPA
ncbi:MAG: hypothetical protein J6Y28_04915 [Acholeplasmatales bacterium]|nr:hypothetical protein [Methanobrevibacter sp.]MBP5445497.1 hypothetical protein [Acholeplasmatales bacterium]